MRSLSIPTYRFAEIADSCLAAAKSKSADARRLRHYIPSLAASCRAFTRLVLRMRAQAEVELAIMSPESSRPGTSNGGMSFSRATSRQASRFCASPSPTMSSGPALPTSALGSFRSPLHKPGRAPLLRVFVLSPEGAWLSDSSVVECEKELRKAGVIDILRPGDVVWDAAVGDESNDGRLVWDGNYLLDLDYTYSLTGDLPQYVHSLAYPPSYWHNVIRVGGNPLCHINLAPYAADMAANMQLLQDRVQVEIPQGGRHTVVRWVHRTRFRVQGKGLIPLSAGGRRQAQSVDAGWEGIVVIEAEGTNEGLADLHGRCGPGAVYFGFEPQEMPANRSSAFRLIREKSRPGEIWLKPMREKDQLM
ncbi:hypothetical protein BOTBODRAFT_119087 [Botryobasidium botryosum FD-172 SS1]|uniref:Uncharacterized protein n=1 Tax=Botryobasidium botryosum (strain FD-172 SS1) TaxID=930990 RepID=A0A067M922_BOTB1|nr:hypothetical protein BOTBODRAFT_119087 [Botryobasidium botryosum FD-172 SS1]